MIFKVWIPGRFSLTNKMLSNLRAAGNYEGYARGKRIPKVKQDAGHDLFARETAAIRLAAKAAAVRQVFQGDEGACPAHDNVWLVTFGVFGHHRHDPDAWYLLGKAVVDGFADAGLLRQDRSDVWDTGGRVLQSRAEEILWSQENAVLVVPSEPGVVVHLSSITRPVPRG